MKFASTILLLLRQRLEITTGSYDTQIQLNLGHRMALWVHTSDEVPYSPWKKRLSVPWEALRDTTHSTENPTKTPSSTYLWEDFIATNWD